MTKQISRYIFAQIFFTVFAGTIVLTIIMWLAQSLRYIDFIANKGVPVFLFLKMIFYLLPNLIVIVIPIAVLIGVLFIYNKLITDHELIVMEASGIGYLQLAKPAILISIIFSIILYLFTIYFLPLSFREYRNISLTLKEETLASLIQVGQFNTLGKYTVYARSQDVDGNFHGILIYDGSENGNSKTFMAEKGILFNKDEGGQLLLMNGNRQERDIETGKPSVLYFERYIIEGYEATGNQAPGARAIKSYERSISDLFNPKEKLTNVQRLELSSAGHQRLISPLYPIIFTLLAVCTILLGQYDRRGRTGKIIMVCIGASLLQVTMMVLLHSIHYSHLIIPICYTLISLIIGICLILLMKGNESFSSWFYFRRTS